MSVEAVRAAIATARAIDLAAALALRLGAVAGARDAEFAALRWDDLEVATSRLTIDNSVEVIRDRDGEAPTLRDAPTKTEDRRVVRLDEATAAEVVALRTAYQDIDVLEYAAREGCRLAVFPEFSLTGSVDPLRRPGDAIPSPTRP